mmetsp:Transcript_12983/g.25191  ORF Transcript_12983/g.25191 Transcript_12983/m.25191 type:complete len:206 (+) Transcript_12983:84-701(+)
MVVVQVRLYTTPASIQEEHAYLVGSSPGGVSDVLGLVHVDDTTCSFERFRGLVELDAGSAHAGTSGGRRSTLFREILFECEHSKNPHLWTNRVRRSSYRLAYMDKEGKPVPKLVPLSIEGETNLVQFVRKHARRDIHSEAVEVLIVPLSQVGPGCNECCSGCAACTEAKRPDSKAMTVYYQDGRIREVAANLINAIEPEVADIAF